MNLKKFTIRIFIIILLAFLFYFYLIIWSTHM